MTPHGDPSPLPPGLLLEREPIGAARRRRRGTHSAPLLVAEQPPAAPSTPGPTARVVPTESVGTESIPNRCQGTDSEPTPDALSEPVSAKGTAPVEDGHPVPADDEQPAPVEGRHPAPVDDEHPAPVEDELSAAPEDGGGEPCPAPCDPEAPAPFRPALVAGPEAPAPPTEDDPPTAAGEQGGAATPPLPTAPTAAPDAGERHSRWRMAAQVAAWTTAVGAVAVVLLVFVFPTRTYVNQRRQLAATASELHLLDSQNAQLAGEVARLHTDSEIERIAREQYHLVQPGESAIAILPAPQSPTPATPLPSPPKPHRSWLHRLTSWLP